MRKPLRVLAYLRVSGREQGASGTSLPDQRSRWSAWSRERGFPEPIFFVEVESGAEDKRWKRTELDRLLAEARPGDLVGVTLVNRWARDATDALVDARTLRLRGIPWIAIDEEPVELLIEPGDDRGIGMLEQRAAGAAEERRSIKRRTVGARRRIRDAGGWPEGAPPVGLRRRQEAAKHERHQLEVVAADAALVVQIFERCAGGMGLWDLGDWWGVERGLDASREALRAQVERILRQRAYLGEVRSSGGQWIRATWPAIVSLDLWTRAHDALKARQKGGRSHSSPRTASWLLRGLGSCPECGARMGAAYSHGSKGGSQCAYYACARRTRMTTNCSGGYARQPETDARTEVAVLARLLELREDLARRTATPKTAAPPDFAHRRRRLDAQLARAEDLAVRGTLSEDGLLRARERIQEELGRIAVAEGAAERASRAADPLARRRLLAEVGAVERAWAGAPVETRRAMVSVLVRQIRIWPDRVEIDWKPPEELSTTSIAGNLFGAPDAEHEPDRLIQPSRKRGRR